MSRKIQIRRGLEINIPVLDTGELGFATDTRKVYIGTAETNVSIASSSFYTATILLSGWVGTPGAYMNEVTISGIKESDRPIIDIVQTGNNTVDDVMIKDWSRVRRGVTSENMVTFYAKEPPVADIPIQLLVVR